MFAHQRASEWKLTALIIVMIIAIVYGLFDLLFYLTASDKYSTGQLSIILKERAEIEVTHTLILSTALIALCLLVNESAQRRKALDILRVSEERYKSLVESQNDAVVRFDGDGHITFANNSLCRVLGTYHSNLIGKPITSYLHQGDSAAFTAELADLQDLKPSRVHLEMRLLTVTGVRWIDWEIYRLIKTGSQLSEYQAVGRDITDKKSHQEARSVAERALRDQLSLLNATIEAIPGGFFYKDKQGRYLGCNNEMARFIGLSKSEIIGHTLYDIAPADLAKVYEEADKNLIICGGRQNYFSEIELMGGERREVQFSKATFILADGEVGGMVGIVTDITEQKAHEQALLEARIEAEAGNVAKASFIATMSHELRTPLNAIIGFSNILREEANAPRNGSDIAEYSDIIWKSGCHLMDILNDLLDISNATSGKLVPQREHIAINLSVKNIVNLIAEQARNKGYTFHHNLSECGFYVYADSRMLKRVLFTICDNAIKFNRPTGIINLIAGKYDGGVTFTCSDTGCGISDDKATKILKPFGLIDKTAYNANEGPGISLALSNKIIELHGGSLEISSAIGVGTTVVIKLPNEQHDDWII